MKSRGVNLGTEDQESKFPANPRGGSALDSSTVQSTHMHTNLKIDKRLLLVIS